MPTLAEQYSDNNVLNSIALDLANKFLSVNYVVYWANRDIVQTLDGSYFGWSTNYATHMADGTFAARIAAADGMVSLTESLSASPTWILRPITTAGPIAQNEHLLPVISVEVGAAVPVRPYELGSRDKWRHRLLMLDGYVTSRKELRKFVDWFGLWYDSELHLDIQDHDAGSLATVGDVEFVDTNVRYRVDPIAVEPVVFQVICTTRLTYIA